MNWKSVTITLFSLVSAFSVVSGSEQYVSARGTVVCSFVPDPPAKENNKEHPFPSHPKHINSTPKQQISNEVAEEHLSGKADKISAKADQKTKSRRKRSAYGGSDGYGSGSESGSGEGYGGKSYHAKSGSYEGSYKKDNKDGYSDNNYGPSAPSNDEKYRPSAPVASQPPQHSAPAPPAPVAAAAPAAPAPPGAPAPSATTLEQPWTPEKQAEIWPFPPMAPSPPAAASMGALPASPADAIWATPPVQTWEIGKMAQKPQMQSAMQSPQWDMVMGQNVAFWEPSMQTMPVAMDGRMVWGSGRKRRQALPTRRRRSPYDPYTKPEVQPGESIGSAPPAPADNSTTTVAPVLPAVDSTNSTSNSSSPTNTTTVAPPPAQQPAGRMDWDDESEAFEWSEDDEDDIMRIKRYAPPASDSYPAPSPPSEGSAPPDPAPSPPVQDPPPPPPAEERISNPPSQPKPEAYPVPYPSEQSAFKEALQQKKEDKIGEQEAIVGAAPPAPAADNSTTTQASPINSTIPAPANIVDNATTQAPTGRMDLDDDSEAFEWSEDDEDEDMRIKRDTESDTLSSSSPPPPPPPPAEQVQEVSETSSMPPPPPPFIQGGAQGRSDWEDDEWEEVFGDDDEDKRVKRQAEIPTSTTTGSTVRHDGDDDWSEWDEASFEKRVKRQDVYSKDPVNYPPPRNYDPQPPPPVNNYVPPPPKPYAEDPPPVAYQYVAIPVPTTQPPPPPTTEEESDEEMFFAPIPTDPPAPPPMQQNPPVDPYVQPPRPYDPAPPPPPPPQNYYRVQQARHRRALLEEANKHTLQFGEAGGMIKPADNAKVQLYEEDTFNFDDLLSETLTNKQGQFSVEGSESELNYIRPYLWVTHSCPSQFVANKNCKFANRIPLTHTTINSTHNLGVIAVGGTVPYDKIMCDED